MRPSGAGAAGSGAGAGPAPTMGGFFNPNPGGGVPALQPINGPAQGGTAATQSARLASASAGYVPLGVGTSGERGRFGGGSDGQPGKTLLGQ